MKPNDLADPLATRSASPSSAEPDTTKAPHDRSRATPRAAAAQLRDPDRYQIINEHGRGGLGRVSRAHDRDLGRDVAIKELISRGNLSEARFLREARITARLEHPGIVPVHEAGRWPDGTPFYAMKLVAGRPLRDLIAERTTVTERIGLLHHVIAVADAIAYAHGRNIIHRDLKPANVIVGDFGETIVIDWGLAKDLSSPDEAALEGGPFRVHPDANLTSTGSVLGTPAYMAPEQERGEHVDQRADVFAIGAMLWELCSLQKVPPTDQQLRHRMLRRAGIDRDLVSIIDKALAPNADQRYGDASALAADLKAFKAGARIAARRYSLIALLTHWIRKHRALSISAAVAVMVAVAVVVLYVVNITSERDRADLAQARAESALAELTLEHANLMLMTDPSATLDILTTYHGTQLQRAAQIRAEAIGRGVAILRAKPHTDKIQWATGAADHSIISLSSDGALTRTSLDQQSTVLATGASKLGRLSYSPSRAILAYACDPANVCIWDISHNKQITSAPEFQHWQVTGMSFSPDGSKLALLSYDGHVKVFDMADPAHPALRLDTRNEHGVAILFADEDAVVIGVTDPLGIERISMSGETQSLTIGDRFVWEPIPATHRLVLVTTQGEGLYIDQNPLRIINRIPLCSGNPTGVKILADQHTTAYACEEGSIGTWDVESHASVILSHMEGHTDTIAVSRSGDYILVAGGNNSLAVVDLYTKLTTTYRGHSSNLTALIAPSEQFPYLSSCDSRGTIRVWPIPQRIARVSANIHTRFASAIFREHSDEILATTFGPELALFSATGESRTAAPHAAEATSLTLASNGETFAAYGASESVEIWSTRGPVRQRVIATGQGAVSRLAFIARSDEFVTAGRDGRLIYRTSAGTPTRIEKFDHPVVDFLLTQNGKAAIINTLDGAVWRAGEHGEIIALRPAGVKVVKMLKVPGAEQAIIAYANGAISALDTVSYHETTILNVSQAPREMVIAPDGLTIAIAGNDDMVYIGRISSDISAGSQFRWTTFRLRAHRIALSPGGLLLAACTDGSIWLYSTTSFRWLCLSVGIGNITNILVSEDEKSAVTFDTDGRVIRLNLDTVRESFAKG